MDRAYEDNETRALVFSRGLVPVVPPKKNRKSPWVYDSETYKRRNEVERFFLRANCQVKCNNFLRKISSGAFQPKDLRGLRLRSRATLSASSCVTSAKDVRLGKN